MRIEVDNLAPNGPAVWLVGVCVAVAWFLQVLADGWKSPGHDETSPDGTKSG